jgi:hypothetical protein
MDIRTMLSNQDWVAANPQRAAALGSQVQAADMFSGQSEADQKNILASWNQPGAGRVSTGPFGLSAAAGGPQANAQMLRHWYQNANAAAGPPVAAPNAGGPPNQPMPGFNMPQPGAQMPAANLSGVLDNNFAATAPAVTAVANTFSNNLGAPAIKPAAQPAAAEKMGYEAAKAKYGRNRAVEMQQAGEVGD